MIDLFYDLLARIGYTHPLHPPLTHIPMGLAIGAFFFALVSLLFRRSILPSFAYRRIILLALIFAFPTALLGYTDWQHFYDGDWLFAIEVKLILTGVLIILLFIGATYGRKTERETKGHLIVYTLCLLVVTGLGYFGAQVLFEGEGRPQNVPIRFLVGQKIFVANCNDCHPGGGDIVDSQKLLDFNKFLALLRDPPEGMPAFPPEKIPDERARRLYLYLVQLSGQQEKK